MLFRLKGGVLGAGDEAGAGFGYVGQLAVTYDAGAGILFRQILQQLIKGMFLDFGAGVDSFPFLVQSTLVHDAERTVVVMPGMHTLYRFG